MTSTIIGRSEEIEALVLADAKARGRSIIPGTLHVLTETVRHAKGGPVEIVGPLFRYDYKEASNGR